MRLHVDRPCHVCRQHDGSWGWQCTLCPMPLRLLTSTSDVWRTAFDEAEQHLRADHATVVDAALAPAEPSWGLAA
ncbi:MAG: hypothetical protein ACRDO1_08965 [Nocardioidaceae bacterium]